MTKVAASLDLRPDYEAIVLRILRRHVPDRKVLGYGSRATWTAKDYSDLDLAILGDEPLSLDVTSALAEAFRESDLPFKVDLVDWARADETFRKIIRRDGITVHIPLTHREAVDLEQRLQLTDETPGVGSNGGEGKTMREGLYRPASRKSQVKQLGDCARLIRKTVLPPFPDDAPYIGLQHIGENTLTLTGQGTGSDVKSAKTKFSRGDILFGKLRPYFRKVIKAPFDGIGSTDIWVVRATEGIDQGFLYYCMASQKFVDFVTSGSEGTRMPRGKWEYACKFELEVPSLDEQRAIAHILGTLDDKIELNQRTNKTLEAMAQALFKSWFVNFDPVHAKAALKNKPVTNVSPDLKSVTHDQTAAALHDSRNATSIGATRENWTSERARTYLNKMDTSVAALFPDSFSDSELGKIPAEWKVRSLKDLLELAYGKSLKASNRHGGVVPVYGSNGQIGWHNRKLVDGPGIVVGRKGNPGRVTWVFTDFYPIDTTFYVVPKNSKQDIQFLFYALKSQDLPSIAADSAVPGLNRKLVYMNKQAIPTNELIDQFNKITTPIFACSHRLDVESRILVAAREALLPKLLSGTIRTSDSCMEVNQRHR